jgi:putative DNA primase/helicase
MSGQQTNGALPDDYGLDRVNAHNAKIARRVARQQKTGVTGVTGVTASNGAASRVTPAVTPQNLGVTKPDLNDSIDPKETPPAEETPFPEPDKRPCYRVYDDWCGKDSKHQPGLYWHYMSKETKTNPSVPVDVRLCGPLRVTAIARNKHGREFGQVLEFTDKDRRVKRWNMPSRLLAGRGDDLQKELFDSGLDIVHSHRSRIAEYISGQHPKERVWTAATCGWHGNDFVLPDQVIGDGSDAVLYQCDSTKALDAFAGSGTLDQWRDNVSRYCLGNPLMILAESEAFSGPLLAKCAIEGIGVHIFGASSNGKTSGMLVAGSVWGEPKLFNKSWTATANGLEAAAISVNDGLFCLDEMSKADADEVSKSLYMLANGTGKQRSNANGTAKQLNTWRVAVLSNGEESIETHLAKRGIAAKPGELVRFLQLPIFGAYGAFDDLHGHESGRLFSDAVRRNSQQYYGTAGVAYLQKLTRDDRDFADYLNRFVEVFEKKFGELSPQEGRAARTFALIGMAGELATEYGVTGWPENTALDTALLCFEKWRAHRGEGEMEPKQLVASIRNYIELYGDARFTSVTDDTRLHGERSGYWRETGDVRQWLFSSAGFKKATGNADPKQAARLLMAEGVLIRGSQDKVVTQVRYKSGRDWFYVIQLEDAADA